MAGEPSDSTHRSVGGETRRWGDRAWDIGLRVIGVLLLAICGYIFSRMAATEAKVQTLEIKSAVNDYEKANISSKLNEIQADIKQIKTKVGVP